MRFRRPNNPSDSDGFVGEIGSRAFRRTPKGQTASDPTVGASMQRLMFSLAAGACLVALFSAAAPAHAGFVTFVSGNGADGVGCGVTPAGACREIFGATGALAQTDEGGIIHVLPGEYIAFPVDKASTSSPTPGRRESSARSLVEAEESW
jgi:hypothetical protein